MYRSLAFLIALLTLAGCQTTPAAPADSSRSTVLLSGQHCLSEYIDDLEKNHYGPCLKVLSVAGMPPAVRADGFIELPVATALDLQVSCVYRHADATPIPQTMETLAFAITNETFPKAGERWYLHAHKQARKVIGCEPTLSRSTFPTYKTD